MNVEVRRLPQSQVGLDFEVDSTSVGSAIDKAYTQLIRQVQIPGFRKGRAPRALVERAVGQAAALQEAAEICINDAYRQAIAEQGLEPLTNPDISFPEGDDQGFDPSSAFRFTATLYVKPEVVLGDYHTLQIPLDVPSITPEQIEDVLQRMQREQALWLDQDPETAAADGDRVMMALQVRVEDDELVNQDEMEYVLHADEPATLPVPHLSFHIIGHKTGDLIVYDVTLPETYTPTDMAGKNMHVSATIKSVQRQDLPDLSDDFAKTLGSFSTLDEVRDAVKQNMQSQLANRVLDNHVSNIVTQVADQAQVEIPPPLIQDELARMIDEMRQDVENNRSMTFDQYLRIIGKDMDALQEELKPTAEVRVKTNLVLEEVARRENVSAPASEVDAEILSMSRIPTIKNRDRKRLVTSAAVRERVQTRLNRRYAVMQLLQIATPLPVPAETDETISLPVPTDTNDATSTALEETTETTGEPAQDQVTNQASKSTHDTQDTDVQSTMNSAATSEE